MNLSNNRELWIEDHPQIVNTKSRRIRAPHLSTQAARATSSNTNKIQIFKAQSSSRMKVNLLSKNQHLSWREAVHTVLQKQLLLNKDQETICFSSTGMKKWKKCRINRNMVVVYQTYRIKGMFLGNHKHRIKNYRQRFKSKIRSLNQQLSSRKQLLKKLRMMQFKCRFKWCSNRWPCFSSSNKC